MSLLARLLHFPTMSDLAAAVAVARVHLETSMTDPRQGRFDVDAQPSLFDQDDQALLADIAAQATPADLAAAAELRAMLDAGSR